MQPCHVLNSLLVTVTFELLLQTDKLTPKNSALKSDLPLNEKPKDQQNNTSCVTLEEFLFHCCNIRSHRQHQDCIPTYLIRMSINSDVVLCSLCFVPKVQQLCQELSCLAVCSTCILSSSHAVLQAPELVTSACKLRNSFFPWRKNILKRIKSISSLHVYSHKDESCIQ